MASKKFLPITRLFSQKWHPNELRPHYLQTFSMEEWEHLDSEEQAKHTLCNCDICKTKYQDLSKAFPSGRMFTHKKRPNISFTENDLSDPKKFAMKVMKESDRISKTCFQQPVQDIISTTPQTGLQKKTSSAERQASKRKVLRDVKNTIQESMDENAPSLVLGNRISWNSYEQIRKSQGLTKSNPRKRASVSDNDTPTPKRKRHGCRDIDIDITELLEEAKSWEKEEKVNWTQLGTKYGLTVANRGQQLKELLAEHGIPAACRTEKPNRTPRRCKKRLPGGKISFPMSKPVKHHKKKVSEKIQSGELDIGEEVVLTSYVQLKVDENTQTITEHVQPISARQISLPSIRKKILEKHETLGIMRYTSDVYFGSLTQENIQKRLKDLNVQCDDDKQQLTTLKTPCRTRHLKFWHDHSDVAGHHFYLLLVSAVYDPVIYYTSDEMKVKGILMFHQCWNNPRSISWDAQEVH